MKGLELCKEFFEEVGRPVLEKECPELMERMTIGLAGEGSDCFGFDDAHSRDHDWGAGFCIWLDNEDYGIYGQRLYRVYEGLPKSYREFPVRNISSWGEGRIGVMDSASFYRKHLGTPGLPKSKREWLLIPENGFATAVNGELFYTADTMFTLIRAKLQQGYPEDIRRKKIAARCMVAGQAGQYNYSRSVKRGELYAARQAEMKFLEASLSILFLLNNSYMPFYKWAHRAVAELPILGRDAHRLIQYLCETEEFIQKMEMIELLSSQVIGEMKRQGLTDGESDFLPDHGPIVQRSIKDPELRQYNLMAG